jgi:hypothetical protein
MAEPQARARTLFELIWGKLDFPNDVDVRRVTYTFVIIAMSGLICVAFHGASAAMSITSWLLASGAFLSIGLTAGFIFAIPRALAKQINSNLELISDWLTKIIVGVGLTQLNQIPGALAKLARFVAGGDSSSGQDQSFAFFVIMYFLFGGFVAGYLETRVYAAGAFLRADEDVIERNQGSKVTSTKEDIL